MTGQKRQRMNSYIQTTMFPDHDRQQIQIAPLKKTKRLPIEKALDLFPRIERQLEFADYFPGFEYRQEQWVQDYPSPQEARNDKTNAW